MPEHDHADPDPHSEFSSAIHSEHDHDHSIHQDGQGGAYGQHGQHGYQGLDEHSHESKHGSGQYDDHEHHNEHGHHGHGHEQQEEVRHSGILSKYECECGCNCNAALRDYLRECSQIPPLKKCDCGSEQNETAALSDPSLKDPVKCQAEECDFSFAPDPNCKCPPMPTCDFSQCRPSWMPCQSPSFKFYPEPEGVEIKPYSAGYSTEAGNFPSDCPMGRLFKCSGVVMDGHGHAVQAVQEPCDVHSAPAEEKKGIFCTIKAKFNQIFGRSQKSAGTGTGATQYENRDDLASDQNENHQDNAGLEDKDKK